MAPLAGRIAGIGLATAALAITILAALLYGDMTRETKLARDIQAIQDVRSGLESLNDALHRLHFAAFAYSRTREASYSRDFNRERVAIEADLDYLRSKASEHPDAASLIVSLEAPARDYLDQTSLALRSGSDGSAANPADETEARARHAMRRLSAWVSGEVNRQTNEQIRLWVSRDTYVRALLAGTLVVLIGLGVAFRQSQERARLDRVRIEQLAHYDVLTGLPNRSLLQFRLANAMAIALRNGAPLALVLFDIDGFKGVNDALGHAAGDELLVSAAARAAECMRASDTAGRLGGDEFLVILPDTGREGARIVAAKLLAALARPFDISGEHVYVSASIGGSFLPGRATGPEQLLKEADNALYESKRRGKNRYSESPDNSADGDPSPAQSGQLDG